MFSLINVIKHFAESLLRAFLVHFLDRSAKHLSRQVMWTSHIHLLEKRHSLKYTDGHSKKKHGGVDANRYEEQSLSGNKKDKEDRLITLYKSDFAEKQINHVVIVSSNVNKIVSSLLQGTLKATVTNICLFLE